MEVERGTGGKGSMKVYVITKGDYSDYHICAVATDSDKAEKLAEAFGDRFGKAFVEEYDTEEHAELLDGKKAYAIVFDKCGNVIQLKIDDPDTTPCIRELYDGSVLVELFAKGIDAAIKIAAERRAQWLAEKEGIA
jgi:hypothetical protein